MPARFAGWTKVRAAKASKKSVRATKVVAATKVIPAIKGKSTAKLAMERAQKDLIAKLATHGLPEPQYEYKFHPVRKWRFDLCWIDAQLAVEINGGIWNGGRHVRAKGYSNDREKVNEATGMGWRVIELAPKSPRDLLDPKNVALIVKLFHGE